MSGISDGFNIGFDRFMKQTREMVRRDLPSPHYRSGPIVFSGNVIFDQLKMGANKLGASLIGEVDGRKWYRADGDAARRVWEAANSPELGTGSRMVTTNNSPTIIVDDPSVPASQRVFYRGTDGPLQPSQGHRLRLPEAAGPAVLEARTKSPILPSLIEVGRTPSGQFPLERLPERRTAHEPFNDYGTEPLSMQEERQLRKYNREIERAESRRVERTGISRSTHGRTLPQKADVIRRKFGAKAAAAYPALLQRYEALRPEAATGPVAAAQLSGGRVISQNEALFAASRAEPSRAPAPKQRAYSDPRDQRQLQDMLAKKYVFAEAHASKRSLNPAEFQKRFVDMTSKGQRGGKKLLTQVPRAFTPEFAMMDEDLTRYMHAVREGRPAQFPHHIADWSQPARDKAIAARVAVRPTAADADLNFQIDKRTPNYPRLDPKFAGSPSEIERDTVHANTEWGKRKRERERDPIHRKLAAFQTSRAISKIPHRLATEPPPLTGRVHELSDEFRRSIERTAPAPPRTHGNVTPFLAQTRFEETGQVPGPRRTMHRPGIEQLAQEEPLIRGRLGGKHQAAPLTRKARLPGPREITPETKAQVFSVGRKRAAAGPDRTSLLAMRNVQQSMKAVQNLSLLGRAMGPAGAATSIGLRWLMKGSP